MSWERRWVIKTNFYRNLLKQLPYGLFDSSHKRWVRQWRRSMEKKRFLHFIVSTFFIFFFFLKKWVKSFTLLCVREPGFFLLLLSTVHILIFESIPTREKKINRLTIGKITLSREWLQGLWEMRIVRQIHTISLYFHETFVSRFLLINRISW